MHGKVIFFLSGEEVSVCLSINTVSTETYGGKTNESSLFAIFLLFFARNCILFADLSIFTQCYVTIIYG